MPKKIVTVKFLQGSKTYWFDPGDLDFEVGEGVIVETVKGIEYAKVARRVEELADEQVTTPLKPIVRKATDSDTERVRKNVEMKPTAMKVAAEKIEKHELDMKLVDAEYAFDGSKLIFYFTSDTRVDFRDLVRDLASYFHIRIELRQIGIRDECKMLGGVAPCGRPCCCANHLNDFVHVSVKMAKNQGLSLNPTKISGLCGRLMCCLQYENAHYVQTAKKMPKQGGEVTTPDGPGIVWSINMLKETVRVKLPKKEGYEIRDFTMDQLNGTVAAADEDGTDEEMPELKYYDEGVMIEGGEVSAPSDDKPTAPVVQPRRDDKREDRRDRGRRERRPDAPQTEQSAPSESADKPTAPDATATTESKPPRDNRNRNDRNRNDRGRNDRNRNGTNGGGRPFPPRDESVADGQKTDDEETRSTPSEQPQSDRQPTDRPQNARPQGGRPLNGRAQGGRPQNDRRRNDRPQGDQPQVEQPQTDSTKSDQPKVDQPQTDKPQSDRPQGGRPQNDRRRNDRRNGAPRNDRGAPNRDDRGSGQSGEDRSAQQSVNAEGSEPRVERSLPQFEPRQPIRNGGYTNGGFNNELRRDNRSQERTGAQPNRGADGAQTGRGGFNNRNNQRRGRGGTGQLLTPPKPQQPNRETPPNTEPPKSE